MIWVVMREGTTAEELDEDIAADLGKKYLATTNYAQAMEHAKSAATLNKHPYVITKITEVARFRPRTGS